MTMPAEWKPITDAQRDGEHYIVGVIVASVLVVRSAWWDDGTYFDRLGFDRPQELRGWWSYLEGGEPQRLDGALTPTHWLMQTPKLRSP